MALSRYIILGSANAELVVTAAQVAGGKTVTIADLEAFNGTLPTFTTAPLVTVLGAQHQRSFDVDSITTTTFDIIASSSGGAPTSATLNIEIISLETVTGAAASGTAIDFPYYCSTNDVENEILNLTVANAATGKLDRSVKRLFISQSFGEIEAALAKGGYDLPVVNSVKQPITQAITAADDVVSFTVTDGTAYPIGKSTVRIHGQSGNDFYSEFVPVVGIATNVLTVEFAKNSYDEDSTCELCTKGFLYLRNCNTLGAAYRAVNALSIKNPQLSEKATEMREVYQMLLDDLKDGNLILDGLSQGGSFIETFQTNNDDENDIIFKIKSDIF